MATEIVRGILEVAEWVKASSEVRMSIDRGGLMPTGIANGLSEVVELLQR